MNGPKPIPRCQHSAVNLGGNLVLVLGGYDGIHQRYLGLDDVCVLNVRSLRWMSLRKPRSNNAVEELQQGMRVRLFGLQAHPELNGLMGTLIGFVDGHSRWQVRLDNGTMDRLMRPVNLEVIDPSDDEEQRASNDGDVEAEESGDENMEERRTGQRIQSDRHAPPMLSPICENASEKMIGYMGNSLQHVLELPLQMLHELLPPGDHFIFLGVPNTSTRNGMRTFMSAPCKGGPAFKP